MHTRFILVARWQFVSTLDLHAGRCLQVTVLLGFDGQPQLVVNTGRPGLYSFTSSKFNVPSCMSNPRSVPFYFHCSSSSSMFVRIGCWKVTPGDLRTRSVRLLFITEGVNTDKS